ncbi:SurA N-terminal domain-containing protein [Roseibium sp. RKSG952]|uniref:SurA N-terminal domain-containing protein n=1 Tax=Roseibium sp. RKSG952 TaxID=2529384 RepID=UPI0012BC7CB5|nr:SurA N-terminal domain-containing protein [Roseibium sp. RKSG952]MTH96225.1 peptidylprolyl isomerase [Roseibium sp. RKSG952]
MLDALRKSAGSWFAKILIGLLVLSFAVWGIADIFTGFGRNVAAKVGSTEISSLTFDRAYRQELNRIGQQLGRPLSTTEGAQFGIPQQTLGRLIAEAAMNEEARQLNLGVSDKALARQIQSDPAFQGPTGGYDRNQLALILRNNGMSEDEYVIERRQLAERQQLAEAIVGRMAAPAAYVEALFDFQNQTRDVEFAVLNPEPLSDIAAPGEEALKTYFEDHKEQFRAPEYREVALLELSPQMLARPGDITDEDARAEYDRNKQDYFQPERRDIRQMTFQSKEDADAAAAKLAGGTTFDELMAERNLSNNDVDLGLMAKADLLDDTIADAAFNMEAGETSGVIDGRFAPVIINVPVIQPETTQPFDAVKADIKAMLAQYQAEQEVHDLLTEIEDARAGGALLQEVSDRFSLPLTTPPAFDQDAKGETGQAVDLPDVDGLIAGTFDSDVGIENDPLNIGRDGYLWYEVTKVIPSRDRTLDEVRDEVITAWKQQEAEKRLNAHADELLKELQNGTSLQTIAQRDGLDVETESGLTRTTPQGAISSGALSQIFAGPDGLVTNVPTIDGNGRVLVKVTNVGQPAYFAESQDVRAIGQQLAQQLQDSLINQYVADIEDTAGVEVNSAVVSQVIGLGNT